MNNIDENMAGSEEKPSVPLEEFKEKQPVQD